MKTIDTLGPDFTRKHDGLLMMARACEVAICGGCAAAIVKDRTNYIPNDLDLVTTKSNALRFLDQVNHFLLDKSVHYRIYVNSHNAFVPAPAVGHFRIQTPFWLPVCLFIIPHDQFRYYRIQGGHLLQLPQDVKQAADVLTEKDAKPRLANDLIEEPDIELPERDEEEPNPFWFDRVDFDAIPPIMQPPSPLYPNPLP